jgi:hypothetical protein
MFDCYELEERMSDLEVMEENEFPYMSSRLKEQDYRHIVSRKSPWKDPLFPHGKYCLFMNHNMPQKVNALTKKKWTEDFKWKRAS